MALTDLFDAWAPDDDEHIAGLDMSYEPPHPPKWIRKTWRVEAQTTPPAIWMIINDLPASDSDGSV